MIWLDFKMCSCLSLKLLQVLLQVLQETQEVKRAFETIQKKRGTSPRWFTSLQSSFPSWVCCFQENQAC